MLRDLEASNSPDNASLRSQYRVLDYRQAQQAARELGIKFP